MASNSLYEDEAISESQPPVCTHTWSRGLSLASNPRRLVTTPTGAICKPRPHHPSRRSSRWLTKHASVEIECNDEDFDLTILDLQTLRRDSKVIETQSRKIRPPEQDVFRVHKPQFHISSENVWFLRQPQEVSEAAEAATASASEEPEDNSTTLGEEEVEIKLPCRSVSINVVEMPCSFEVTSGIIESPQLPPLPPLPTPKATAINFLPPFGLNGLATRASASYGIQCNHAGFEKMGPFLKYRRPALVSLISVGFLLALTFLVLYLNYHENVYRKKTRIQGYILDHWGKGSPSAAETAILDLDVEILRRQEMEMKRKSDLIDPTALSGVDDLLYIDGHLLNPPSKPTKFKNALSTSPRPQLDRRVP